MTKAQTQFNASNLSTTVKALRQQCEDWETGAFKSSNEQLYAILQTCHTLLGNLRGETKLRKAFNALLDTLGIEYRSNTSLELKVVKAAFGKDNNRIHAYARLLEVAKTDLPTGTNLPEWITQQGGVEEIRRKPKDGPTPAEKAKRNRERAEEVLHNIDPISESFDPDDSLKPSRDSAYAFSVALVRLEKDGKATVVYGTNKTRLIEAVLAEAGANISERAIQQEITSKQTRKRQERDAVLDADDDDFATADDANVALPQVDEIAA